MPIRIFCVLPKCHFLRLVTQIFRKGFTAVACSTPRHACALGHPNKLDEQAALNPFRGASNRQKFQALIAHESVRASAAMITEQSQCTTLSVVSCL
jgi:hypothetical protein